MSDSQGSTALANKTCDGFIGITDSRRIQILIERGQPEVLPGRRAPARAPRGPLCDAPSTQRSYIRCTTEGFRRFVALSSPLEACVERGWRPSRGSKTHASSVDGHRGDRILRAAPDYASEFAHRAAALGGPCFHVRSLILPSEDAFKRINIRRKPTRKARESSS